MWESEPPTSLVPHPLRPLGLNRSYVPRQRRRVYQRHGGFGLRWKPAFPEARHTLVALDPQLDEEKLAMIREHSVLPYIAEQIFGFEESRLEDFALARLWKPIGG